MNELKNFILKFKIFNKCEKKIMKNYTYVKALPAEQAVEGGRRVVASDGEKEGGRKERKEKKSMVGEAGFLQCDEFDDLDEV